MKNTHSPNLCIFAYTCEHSIWEVEAVVLQIHDQSELHSENLPQTKSKGKQEGFQHARVVSGSNSASPQFGISTLENNNLGTKKREREEKKIPRNQESNKMLKRQTAMQRRE